MKKRVIKLLFCFIANYSFAQTAPPEGINYQAVAYGPSTELVGLDVANTPVANKEVSVRFSIFKNT